MQARPVLPFSELVSAARAGDARAMEQLLADVQPDLRRYARRSCERVSDIDDAVQDTLLAIYRRLGSLRDIALFPFWMTVIVTRMCWRMARKAFGAHVTIEAVSNDLHLSERPLPELRLTLAMAIQSLPEHYRDIVILRDFEEYTIDEIAVLRNLSREAVKGQLFRARGLIREHL